MTQQTTKRLTALGLATVFGLTAAACGTRVDRQAAAPAVSESDPGPSPVSFETDRAAGAGTAGEGSAATASAGSALGSSAAPASAGAAGGSAARAPAAPSVNAPGGRATGEAPGATAGPGGRPSPGGPVPPEGGPVGDGSSGVGPVGNKSPIRIATVGYYSGPIGAILLMPVQAVQAWVRSVNSRGGLNGHKVEYVIYDDGNDPARHKSHVQEAIERRNVVAFVANSEGTTGRPSQSYITSKGVPVIGSEGAGQWFYESPMYFPQTTHGDAFFHMATYGTALFALPAGKTRLGSTACVEIEACGTFDKEVAGSAKDAGFEHVFRNRASVAQPDYSAECIAARNAGVQAWLIAMDGSSVIRLAQACARQGYRPLYATLGSIAIDRMKDEPSLEGMIVPLNAFPFFQSGTPATDEFQRVIQAAKVPLGAGSAVGWVSAKLFEKAAANMPEPPTAAAVLRGLWSLKDDTLGGLTLPLTFTENKPAPIKMCWFTMVSKQGAWTTPDNYKLNCVPTK